MALVKRPLRWIAGEVTVPPFSEAAHDEAMALLERAQNGAKLSLPHSRPMPSIGPRCHELRIKAENVTHRIIYRTDADAIVVAEVFVKKTPQTPPQVLKNCQRRYRLYDEQRRD